MAKNRLQLEHELGFYEGAHFTLKKLKEIDNIQYPSTMLDLRNKIQEILDSIKKLESDCETRAIKESREYIKKTKELEDDSPK